MARELAELRVAGMKPTAGDIRCIAFGHITRMAIWNLRPIGMRHAPTAAKAGNHSGSDGRTGDG